MEIIQVYQTKNPSYARNRSISPVGVFVHSTGANNKYLKRYVDAPDRLGKNEYNNHWNQSSANKSVHAWIGYDKNKEVIVANTLPYDRACWGAGSGKKGSYNYDPQAYIQFEICEGSSTDSDYYWKAIAVAEEYCAYLCKKFGWTAKNITSHYEAYAAGYASNHGDPKSWMKHFGDSMDKFRSRVQTRLDAENSHTDKPEENVEETPAKEPISHQSATYTVKGGDSLWAIAANVLGDGSRYKEIMELNGLQSSTICKGDVLKLPVSGSVTIYTVKKGDSLWKIADQLLGNGNRYKEIVALNELESTTISTGQKLKIPNG